MDFGFPRACVCVLSGDVFGRASSAQAAEARRRRTKLPHIFDHVVKQQRHEEPQEGVPAPGREDAALLLGGVCGPEQRAGRPEPLAAADCHQPAALHDPLGTTWLWQGRLLASRGGGHSGAGGCHHGEPVLLAQLCAAVALPCLCARQAGCLRGGTHLAPCPGPAGCGAALRGQGPPCCNQWQLLMEEEALDFLAAMCDGDARTALNSLQAAVEAHREGDCQCITAKSVKEGLQRTHFHYDRADDQHYDVISAFIKSMRGGDANGALYYLARMLAGGEDPLFIARRLVIFASEDIGLADNQALVLAVAAHDSVMKVGLPECRITLSHCAVYCARAPKSRETYEAFARAEAAVRGHVGPLPAVPVHLRNHASAAQRAEGCGKPFLPQQIAQLDFFDQRTLAEKKHTAEPL
ncbi:ATPase WRNIP1-like isoform X3 [Amblyomma americanum]